MKEVLFILLFYIHYVNTHFIWEELRTKETQTFCHYMSTFVMLSEDVCSKSFYDTSS